MKPMHCFRPHPSRLLFAMIVAAACPFWLASGGCDAAGSSTDAKTSSTTTSSAQGAGGATASTSAQGGGHAGSGQGGDGKGGEGQGGEGGEGQGGGGQGGALPWPTCDSPPADVAVKTIPQLWQDDPVQPTEVWVSGVIVTALSKSACVAGQPCQIYLQQDPSYANFAAGAHHAIKLFASPPTAAHFDKVKLNDVVDVRAYAWRYTVGGQNELMLQVNLQLPGCIKPTSTAQPTPIVGVKLGDLSKAAYESTHGPLLVQVAQVSGKPAMPAEPFALWHTGVFSDAGVEQIVSLSPYFLPKGELVGLSEGQKTAFSTITGVFGMFVPPVGDGGTAKKYLELYPRSMAELVLAK